MNDPNTQAALHSIGQSLTVIFLATKVLRSEKGLKAVGADQVPKSLAGSATFASITGGPVTVAHVIDPNAPIGGSYNQYQSQVQQVLLSASTTQQTGHG